MARDRIAGPAAGVDPAAAALIEDYLADITGRLPGPRRPREAAIGELRDGLHDTLDAYRETGLDGPAAAHAAIAESGPPTVVAASYRPLLAGRHARRTSRMLLVTGPFVGLLWLLALVPGNGPAALLLTVPALGAMLAVGVLAGLAALAATGRIGRWLPDIPGLPQLAAALVCAAAIAIDITALTLVATRLATPPSPPQWPTALLAAAASLVRLAYTQRAARSHLHPAH